MAKKLYILFLSFTFTFLVFGSASALGHSSDIKQFHSSKISAAQFTNQDQPFKSNSSDAPRPLYAETLEDSDDENENEFKFCFESNYISSFGSLATVLIKHTIVSFTFLNSLPLYILFQTWKSFLY